MSEIGVGSDENGAGAIWELRRLVDFWSVCARGERVRTLPGFLCTARVPKSREVFGWCTKCKHA